MESMSAGTEAYNKIITDVMDHLRKHNDSEENEDLPLLEPKLGQTGSEQAAQKFKTTKKFVPTRYVLRI